MIGTVHAQRPLRVQVDSSRDAGLLAGLAGHLGRAVWTACVFTWRAPLLTLAALSLAAAAWAVWAGHSLPVLGVLAGLAALAGLTWWRRPAALARLADLAAGQALRALVYRPRWATACMTAHITTRAGALVHLPVLLRHTRRHGTDHLTVRMAPGQTITDWWNACPGLATTFAAASVTALPAARPGWVDLTVQRHDPLRDSRTSPAPARCGLGPVELGRDEYGNPFTIDPTATVHMGLQGAARSSKSSACYTLLGALAYRSDVAVVGLDPSGLLLGPFQHGPNAHLIACGTADADLDHGVRVLDDLVAQMDARISGLRLAGVDKLTAFSPAMPALWVVMEEYPGLISAMKSHDLGVKPADRLAPRVERAIGRLVKEGAKVGVCVLFIAQRMSAEALATDDRANLAVRVTLRVDNTDAVRMLHDGISGAAMERIRQFAPGVGLVESPGAPIRRVRFHFTDYATYRARVAAGLDRARAGQVHTGTVIAGELLPLRERNGVPDTQEIPIDLGGAA